MDRIQRIGEVAEIMRDYVENKKTFLTDKTMRVPTQSYTDADQWKAEMELIFKRVPLMLAFTAELPNPGDYERLMELIRGVTTQPVKFVINTSSKAASSGNNAKFQAAGAEIVTTERTLTLGDAQVRTKIGRAHV